MSNSFPLIRFWQGFFHPSLTDGEAMTALEKGLIPRTTEVGAGQGLIGYLPVVIKKEHKPDFLPDEMALVIYRNQKLYDAIKKTPEGDHYGKMHFKLNGVGGIPGMEGLEGREFFVPKDAQGRMSISAVAQTVADEPDISPFESVFDAESIVYGNAYAPVWGEEAVWQGGAVLVRVHLRQEGTDDYAFRDSIAHYLKYSAGSEQIEAHVVRVEKNYFVEYLFGRDEAQIQEALEEFDGSLEPSEISTLFQTTWLRPLADEESRARNFTLTRDGEGSGYQLRFDILPELPRPS